MSAGSSPAWSTTVPPGTAPALNQIERQITIALATLDLRAAPFEHSFSGAEMWVERDGMAQLYVDAYPLSLGVPQATMIAERTVAGLSIASVQDARGRADQFECADLRVTVIGVPDGFVSADAFLEAFIGSLGC